ncbi:hypothetical protein OY14_00675 [Borreliella chilensis]|uniref:FAD-binding FR-type domain-containing protein n=1 Tax=Borreliella chilensis TaxID=1245910 RepID=A0A0A7UV67_9SPIR|nr:hypothetical protein OY14_00675 [Borreliella chilensis]
MILDGKISLTVLDNKSLNNKNYVLRFERKNIIFKEGQYLLLSLQNFHSREYSIYSGVDDNFFEVLIRELEVGNISKKLRMLQAGDQIYADGPFGHFVLNDKHLKQNKLHYFIATGTGISPFHSFVKSKANLFYKLIHGIKTKSDKYNFKDYENYTSCISKDKEGDFSGRVTDYLKNDKIDSSNTVFYICGNNWMAFDVLDILREKSVACKNIKTEIYF